MAPPLLHYRLKDRKDKARLITEFEATQQAREDEIKSVIKWFERVGLNHAELSEGLQFSATVLEKQGSLATEWRIDSLYNELGMEDKLEKLEEKEAQLMAKDEEIKAKDMEIQAKDEEVKAKDEEINAKDDEINTKDEEINAKDEEIKAKDEQIAQLMKALKAKDELLALKDEHIANLKAEKEQAELQKQNWKGKSALYKRELDERSENLGRAGTGKTLTLPMRGGRPRRNGEGI
ncbi:uncharacterized protein EI97DRAFT_454318 [Westerdykella ornata]|uniref:Uncharacterized protein n=1 Tax=Westerdykella ornata TaxID=318751 RepID=A0A6A6JWW4_WESOR|nr:uncharacterized protein EI97DRAFT_454318 [Westerdykella ornata]KAF2281100.1 hypothetical protein EI97DRAFT_454318 [Westerdykella ornata]